MTQWDELEQACKSCDKCALSETRTHVVFGEGSRDAEVMLIGEAPGQEEDAQARPFVGRSGRLLTDMLAVIGLTREKVFIANTIKCRPPGNRDPLHIEQDACMDWLRRQTRLLRPKIIVCVGRVAAQLLIREDFRITQEHGQWFDKAGVAMMAIYHPAFLLRSQNKKPEAFEDLKTLERKIRELCTRTTLD